MGVVIIDPRQGSGDLVGLMPSGTCELGRIDDAEGRGIGDAMSDGWGPDGPILWGMEIKKLSDALDSLQTGRLPASQLVRMHENFAFVFLLIEADMCVDHATGRLQKRLRLQNKRTGKWFDKCVDVLYGNSKPVHAVHFFEWLLSIHICGGARLLFSSNRETTAAWITAVSRLLSKPWDEHDSLNVFDESHPPRFVIPSKAMTVAKDLADGIGWEKAGQLADHFGSAQALINATVDELRAVDDIGDVLAGRLFSGAREPHRKIVKYGSTMGGRDGRARAHSNVLAPPSSGVAKKRGANRRPVSGPKRSARRRSGG